MWTLTKPVTDDSRDLLARALSRDRGAPAYEINEDELLTAIERYSQYDQKNGLAHKELRTSVHLDELANAIHDAYNQVQEGARLKELRSRLLLSAKLCPYCSSPAITDLDHYLPRSKYKDFSIYAANLVPSCHPCNNVKRAFSPDENPEHHLIHPYYETFPDQPIMEIDTTISENGGIAPVLYVPQDDEGEHATLRAKAQFQIEKFRLNTRLTEAINLFLSNHEVALESIYSTGGADKVAEYLHLTATKTAERLGQNDWHARLLFSLAANAQFCDGGFQSALGQLDFGERLA